MPSANVTETYKNSDGKTINVCIAPFEKNKRIAVVSGGVGYLSELLVTIGFSAPDIPAVFLSDHNRASIRRMLCPNPEVLGKVIDLD